MTAWTTRMMMKMQALGAQCSALAIQPRASEWMDSLVDRLVCCGGHDVTFEENHDDEPREEDAKNNSEEVGKQHDDSVISGQTGPSQPDTESAPAPESEVDVGDALNTKEDDSITDDDQEDKARMDTRGDSVSGRHTATIVSNADLRPGSHRAALVLQRFLKGCLSSHQQQRQRTPIVHHGNPSPPQDDATSHAPPQNDDRVHNPHPQRLSRLRAPQVHPRRLSVRPSSQDTVRTRTCGNARSPTVPTVRSSRSPPSPVSSTYSRCSFGSSVSVSCWRDTHSTVLAENMVFRKRLETTPVRVYDFVKDPRFVSEQQQRRMAILH